MEAPPDDQKALLEVPGRNSNGIYIALLKVEAEHNRSKATALKVNILGLRLKVLEATCENGHGESSIIGTDGDSEEDGVAICRSGAGPVAGGEGRVQPAASGP